MPLIKIVQEIKFPKGKVITLDKEVLIHTELKDGRSYHPDSIKSLVLALDSAITDFNEFKSQKIKWYDLFYNIVSNLRNKNKRRRKRG